MIQGKSPRLMFDIIMCRFKESYNPVVIYDASCCLKEMGLNREPKRFLDLLICSDPVHCGNHTTCLPTFLSTKYPHLDKANKEAAEQFNSILRNVAHSVTFMNYNNYMSAMKIFMAFNNLREN